MRCGYRRTKEDLHHDYLDMPSTPVFAFGHGLSYTTFQYGPLTLASNTVDVSGDARVSLSVTNTGKRRGTEIVQLYAADTATGVTLPAQQLIGFSRVDLEPGMSNTVSFVVPMSMPAYTGFSGQVIMKPGPLEVSAGSSSDDIRSKATITVTGTTRTIRSEDRKFFSSQRSARKKREKHAMTSLPSPRRAGRRTRRRDRIRGIGPVHPR